MGVEAGAHAARSRALAVLRIRSRAVAVALLPAAVAVVLLVGGADGRLSGGGWSAARGAVTTVAVVALLCGAGIALVVARARPAVSPTVPVGEKAAPDLYRMVRDLADRLDVPVPSAIALTPDCDSWLEDRTHRAHGRPPRTEGDGPGEAIRGARGIRGRLRAAFRTSGGPGTEDGSRRADAAPVLVIGSPFLWWMRVGELRAVLAPVVAGTGPSAHPDIAAARRFVRGLDAAVAATSAPGRGPLVRAAGAGAGWVARLLLRSCRGHAAEMERGVAAAAAERAQTVDYGVRIVAQEQVGLAYAGWDRLLTRVALPAWRMGRWPSRLDAGVVAALTELSRRDRLAEGFTSRLGERPACDLLEEPGTVDEAASLLAARLFHGGPAEPGPDWAPVAWHEYPEEVVDRKWRADAARLHRVLDALGVHHRPDTSRPDTQGPTLARVLDHLTVPEAERAGHGSPAAGTEDPDPDPGDPPGEGAPGGVPDSALAATEATEVSGAADAADGADATDAGDAGDVVDGIEVLQGADVGGNEDEDEDEAGGGSGPAAALAAVLTAEVAREEAAAGPGAAPAAGQQAGPDRDLLEDGMLPLFPLQPPRTGRELLADHVTALVCCAAMDTAGAVPGLDWLDGPTLLLRGKRAADLPPRVRTLVDTGDPGPLRDWLGRSGVRAEKPVRLV
ncbi:hypothetical protein [Streptomyces griseoaurantiacus]|uniref:Uncharacterized protein n=1 Tax=Streptomyces griseoaurantiacus TaxID=68213 RepID=A0A7W2DWA2_9ACTN|nr:hypothetical protein [Streptomyces griseoaurantiacus]MBA5224204.1 hypothetical protein [Streptomyces griseoaurantiacus]